jgi:hypothetical protein
LAGAFEESDLRAGIKDGGQILGAFIVARSEEEFVIYMRPSWGRGRGFKIVRTWRGASGDRSFKNLQSAWLFVRKFSFSGQVMVYPLGDPDLRGFVGVDTRDLGNAPQPPRGQPKGPEGGNLELSGENTPALSLE